MTVSPARWYLSAMRGQRVWLAFAVFVTTGAVGCGPVEYIGQVTRRASGAVAEAKAARADQLAPYEYTLAVEYLHKAREEAAHADFQAANRFGRKSSAAAKKAAELAAQRAADPDRAARELPPPGMGEVKGKSFSPLEDPSPPAGRSGEGEVPPGLEDEP